MFSGIASIIMLFVLTQFSNMNYTIETKIYAYSSAAVFLFWFFRMWKLTSKSLLKHDPILFISKDPISYLTGVIIFSIAFIGF